MRSLRKFVGCIESAAHAAKGSQKSWISIAFQVDRQLPPHSISNFAASYFTKASHRTAQRTLNKLDWRREFGFATQAIKTSVSKPSAPLGLGGSRLLQRCSQQLSNLKGFASVAATAATSKTQGIAAAFSPASLSAGIPDGWRKALAVWLGGCSAWVFALVILGGITRLTRSGLSMTDWKFTGERPPQTEAEWEEEFAKYKLSPEFRRVNSAMNVEEFKFIYWMEYAHRMWGRALGLIFAIPAAVFVAKGAVNGALARRMSLLFLMGGTQGLVGWWMVRSGLKEPENNQVPRVSPYRLAAHLVSAFAIYATLVWTTLGLAVPYPPSVSSGPSTARAAALLFKSSLPVAALIAITAASGAFVAGLDAGHAFNTFPDMNGQWIPDEYWDMTGWRNAFENTAAVQLHHRALAITTLIATLALWRYGTRIPDLAPSSRLLLHGLAAGACAQVGLGIATLLSYVPVSLGSAHQGGALTLFTLVLGVLYSTRPAPGLAPYRLARLVTPAAAAAVVGVGGTVVQLH